MGGMRLIRRHLTHHKFARRLIMKHATVTSFTATIDLTAPPVSPGQITVTNGVTHIRGQINQGPITGDIVGTATAVFI